MIRLPNTGTYSLELVTAQNGAQVVVCYSDATSNTYVGGIQTTTISSATTTTICSTPAASTIRDVDEINIKNTFAGSHTITVQVDANATNIPLVTASLLTDESLNYTHGSGWQCKDANGNTKTTPLTAMTSAQLAAIVSDETGSGALVFATSPTLVTPALGTPASGDLRNCSLAVAPAIGGTTPAAGAFTTLTANSTAFGSSGNVTISSVGGYRSTGVGGYLAVQGSGNPLSGAGIEINGGAADSFILGYDRTLVAYIPVSIKASQLLFKYNGSTTIADFSSAGLAVTGSFSATTSILSSGATSGIGYKTGAGGTVAQGSGSGKATGVTLAKVCGTITMDGASLAADTTVTFLLTMTGFTLNATDQFVLSHISVGTFGAYNLNARYASATTMNVDVRNTTPGALAEAIVIQYSLIRSVAA